MQYIYLVFIFPILNRELFIERAGTSGAVTPSSGDVLRDRLCPQQWHQLHKPFSQRRAS